MSDYRYRDDRTGWQPFEAEGYTASGGFASALDNLDPLPVKRQPIGFRGSAPGPSYDHRGLPRIRVKAGSIKIR